MFDQMVRTMAGWDWVTPLVTAIRNWQRSPSVGFLLPYAYAFSAWEVQRFLRGQGTAKCSTMRGSWPRRRKRC